MALILAESFDRYSINGAASPWAPHANANMSNPAGRGAVGQCLKIPGTQFATITNTQIGLDPASVEKYIGMSIKFERPDKVDTHQFMALVETTTTHFKLGINADGSISAYMGNTLRGTSTGTTIPLDTWVSLEVYVNMNNAGHCTVKINGEVVLDIAADFYSLFTPGTILNQALAFYGEDYGLNNHVYIDNLYVCDSLGATHNTFLGDVRFSPLNALVDTATTDFTDVGTGASSAARLNDALPDEATYVASSTVGHQDRFTISPVGVSASAIIALCVTAYAKKDGGGERVFKTQLVSGATTEDSVDRGLGDAFDHFVQIVSLDPNTGAAWVKANADAVQVGVEIVS